MRNFIFLCFIVFLCFGSRPAFGQAQPNFCGTVGKSDWLIEYQKNRQAYAEYIGDTTWLYVPVTFHVVGTDAGTGYFSIARIAAAVCHMNEQFAPSFIKVYLHPTLPLNYLPNTEWYIHTFDGGDRLINENIIPDRLNAFIVRDPAGNCGYSWQDAIVLGTGCSSANNSTWAHELGHHLSLPHPFYGWEGRSQDGAKPAPTTLDWADVEKVDRSNCLTAGDGFCDTRPDYISDRWNCDANGESSQFLDPDSVAFRSDGTYLMGYANDGCQNRFMPDQTDAMRANLRTEHRLYLVETEHGPILADDSATKLAAPLDSSRSQFNQVTFKWHPLAGAEYYSLEIGLFSTMSPLIHFEALRASDTSYTHRFNLPKNKTLFWRVKAYSAWDLCNDQSNYQVGVFRTADLTANNELEQSYEINIAPNPVHVGREIQVDLISDQTEPVLAQILDITGRSVWSQKWNVPAGAQTFLVPSEQLATGTYRFMLHNQRGIITRQIAIFE
jgi:hypothetical protein